MLHNYIPGGSLFLRSWENQSTKRKKKFSGRTGKLYFSMRVPFQLFGAFTALISKGFKACFLFFNILSPVFGCILVAIINYLE